jgi:substrate import-associated zinc metallohydrolase lipoprotein
MKRIIYTGIAVLILFFVLVGCQEEKLGPTIFDTSSEQLDPTSASYKLDKYLYDNFTEKYNLQFRYKMQDVGADMEYNLVPASYENSKKMAVLVKYLWFDVYAKVVGPDFLKAYGPRIIHLIGSAAFNPANGTILLGLAEGGLKVSLFRVNAIDPNSVDMLNEYYFKTMHHEFSHILHQTKTYPKEFNLISFKDYETFNWQDRDQKVAASLGFVSPYGGSQTREDFVEVIANYIVKTDAQWNLILDEASKGWVVNTSGVLVQGTDADGVDGKATILRKLSICRTWLRDSWNVDLDALREEVQLRQKNINLDSLLLDIDNIK